MKRVDLESPVEDAGTNQSGRSAPCPPSKETVTRTTSVQWAQNLQGPVTHLEWQWQKRFSSKEDRTMPMWDLQREGWNKLYKILVLELGTGANVTAVTGLLGVLKRKSWFHKLCHISSNHWGRKHQMHLSQLPDLLSHGLLMVLPPPWREHTEVHTPGWLKCG